MSKHKFEEDSQPSPPSPAEYKRTMYELHVQLVKLQSHVIRNAARVLIILEGRDGAGKDGLIKRFVKHLSPRDTRVVALAKPSDREASSWYFQRFVAHLPTGGEMVLFNRSWYNRAGVERVMGFCTSSQVESFMEATPHFERLLVDSGTILRKYYLDISKAEQERRLGDRSRDPLKQWKVSPIDEVAVDNWEKYSEARDEMLARTHTPFAPWDVVRADDKRLARLNAIKAVLASIDYHGKDERVLAPNPDVVFRYDVEQVKNGRIAP